MSMAATSNMFSSLNPNAPDFVPQAYKAVEDFSPEWWFLVQTSPAFADFWTREHAQQIEAPPQELSFDDIEDELPEEDAVVFSSLVEDFASQHYARAELQH